MGCWPPVLGTGCSSSTMHPARPRCREAGDPAAARDQVAALLPVREQVLGGEHPDTLAAQANLARWTGEAGDPAAARDQYAALLPVRERVLGAQHPHTLSARANLARWTGQATARATNEDHPGT